MQSRIAKTLSFAFGKHEEDLIRGKYVHGAMLLTRSVAINVW